MRKEVLFAVVAGSLFGLLIAFGIWRANQALTSKKDNNIQKNDVNKSNSEFAAAILSPGDKEVITSSSVQISGTTKPESLVVISGEDSDYLVSADTKGAFTSEVDLTGGLNEVVTIAFDSLANSTQNKKLTLVYSSEFKLASPQPSETPESTTDAIRQKVQEKINEASKKPQAYIGTITDITETTLQIKNDSGEIQQISLKDQSIVYVKTSPTSKVIKATDLAIGDYIVAMGYKNGNSVLNASRVLVVPVSSPTLRTATMGIVATINKNTITIKDQDQIIETSTLTTVSKKDGDKLTKLKLSNITEGVKIIAVGDPKDNVLSARKVYIIN